MGPDVDFGIGHRRATESSANDMQYNFLVLFVRECRMKLLLYSHSEQNAARLNLFIMAHSAPHRARTAPYVQLHGALRQPSPGVSPILIRCEG